MNYIYDIYLNLNEVLYDFFDWNKNDKITHIKKIPVIVVNENILKELINCKIKINDEILQDIYNKTELWNLSEKIDYCALFSDSTNILAIEFDNSGISKRYSYLQVDEELEVLESIRKYREKCIGYELLSKNQCIFKTRKELKDEKFIEKELNTIENEKLRYIYFECFGKHEKNRKTILNSIKNLSKNSKVYKNLYDILKLTSTTKNKMV